MRHVQIRAFHNVAIHGGFSRAAEAMGLTQPALSDQVRKLEQDYDVLLFTRDKKRVSLTTQGQGLLKITLPLFEAESRAHEFLSERRALTTGALRIIADSACHVTGILSRFRAIHPGVRITMRAGNSADVMAQLSAYKADIGVLGSLVQTAGLDHVPLGSSPVIAFCRRDFPGLPEGAASLEGLLKLPLVLREKGSKTRQKLEDAARLAGLTLTPAIEAEGREAVHEIVASGAGVGFVSIAEYGHDARLVKIPIKGAPIPMEETVICLSHRRDVRLIRAFMGLARQQTAPDKRQMRAKT